MVIPLVINLFRSDLLELEVIGHQIYLLHCVHRICVLQCETMPVNNYSKAIQMRPLSRPLR